MRRRWATLAVIAALLAPAISSPPSLAQQGAQQGDTLSKPVSPSVLTGKAGEFLGIRPFIRDLGIPLDLAQQAADAAMKTCTNKHDGSISVAVIDSQGVLKVFLSHEDVRSWDAYEHARRKAYTTLLTGKPSREYPTSSFLSGTGKLPGTFADAPPLQASDLSGKAGALPIMRGPDLAGVISVDGRWNYASNEDEDWNADEKCAQAGLDAIRDKLKPLSDSERQPTSAFR